MKAFVLALGLLSVVQVSAAQAQTAPQGDPGKGRAMFSGAGGSGLCMLCHGRNAEGGFGPDLAGGRGLSFEQFKRAVQQPWGVMPKYTGINDEGLANIYAFLKSLPPAKAPGVWNVSSTPPPAPRGQLLMIEFGCGQCHGPEIGHPRRDIGEKMADIDFAAFQKIIYETAPAQMGHFNPNRLSEPIAREIWGFMKDMGFRSFLWASMAPGVPAGGNTTFTLTLDNKGEKGKGMAAEDITVSLVLPAGVTAVSGTGGKYEGVKKGVEYVTNPGDLSPFKALNPNPNPKRATADAAVWKIGKIAAGDKTTISITLSGVTGVPNFTGSTITWNKPDVKRLPNVTLRDDRLADKGDILYAPSPEFTLPPQPKPTSSQN